METRRWCSKIKARVLNLFNTEYGDDGVFSPWGSPNSSYDSSDQVNYGLANFSFDHLVVKEILFRTKKTLENAASKSYLELKFSKVDQAFDVVMFKKYLSRKCSSDLFSELDSLSPLALRATDFFLEQCNSRFLEEKLEQLVLKSSEIAFTIQTEKEKQVYVEKFHNKVGNFLPSWSISMFAELKDERAIDIFINCVLYEEGDFTKFGYIAKYELRENFSKTTLRKHFDKISRHFKRKKKELNRLFFERLSYQDAWLI